MSTPGFLPQKCARLTNNRTIVHLSSAVFNTFHAYRKRTPDPSLAARYRARARLRMDTPGAFFVAPDRMRLLVLHGRNARGSPTTGPTPVHLSSLILSMACAPASCERRILPFFGLKSTFGRNRWRIYNTFPAYRKRTPDPSLAARYRAVPGSRWKPRVRPSSPLVVSACWCCAAGMRGANQQPDLPLST
jgi:hypothetical protein